MGNLLEPHFLQGVGKILLCCLALIGALLVGGIFIHPLGGPLMVRISGTLIWVAFGVGAYFLSAKLLKLPDLPALLRRQGS